MSSLTLKGKPSEQASLPPINSGAPLTSTATNASSGVHLDYLFILSCCQIEEKLLSSILVIKNQKMDLLVKFSLVNMYSE